MLLGQSSAQVPGAYIRGAGCPFKTCPILNPVIPLPEAGKDMSQDCEQIVLQTMQPGRT